MGKLFACCLGTVLGGTVAIGTASAAPISEKIGERVSRGVVEESLEALDKKENQARLGRILNSPYMRAAMHDLTASIVIGVFDGIQHATKNGLIGKTNVAKSVGDGLNEHITPAASTLTYKLVDSAMSASLSDKNVARVQKLGEGATHAALRGVAHGLEQDLGPALAVTLDRDLGPAIATMIERDIMPAVGRGLNSADMQTAITRTTNSVATGLVYGTDNALDETNIAETDTGESKLKVFGGRLAIGYAIALFVAFAFGTMLVVMTVVLVRNSRRQRKQQDESKRREQALLHLIDSIESDYPELKTDMRRLLREQLHTEQ